MTSNLRSADATDISIEIDAFRIFIPPNPPSWTVKADSGTPSRSASTRPTVRASGSSNVPCQRGVKSYRWKRGIIDLLLRRTLFGASSKLLATRFKTTIFLANHSGKFEEPLILKFCPFAASCPCRFIRSAIGKENPTTHLGCKPFYMIVCHDTRVVGIEVRCISVIEPRIKWRPQFHAIMFLQLPRIH